MCTRNSHVDWACQILTYPNGLQTQYAYDSADRIWQTYTVQTNGNVGVSLLAYTHNAVGNRDSLYYAMPAAAITGYYGYDNNDRLTSETWAAGYNQSYTYDEVGNRTAQTENGVNKSYVINDLNQYTIGYGLTLTYDTKGNLSGTPAFPTVTYDTANRITQATGSGYTNSYVYDFSNRLVSKTVNGVQTKYVYDGWNVVEELNSGNSLVKKYIHGPAVDEILTQEQSGTSYYLTKDVLGSTREISNASGTVLQRFFYDAFGRIVATWDGNSNPITDPPISNYLFTGRELMPELLDGWNYRNRLYLSTIGRFAQPDPIGFDGGDVNIYSYVENNPLLHIDPDGLAPLTIVGCDKCPWLLKGYWYRPEDPEEGHPIIPVTGPVVGVDGIYTPDGKTLKVYTTGSITIQCDCCKEKIWVTYGSGLPGFAERRANRRPDPQGWYPQNGVDVPPGWAPHPQ